MSSFSKTTSHEDLVNSVLERLYSLKGVLCRRDQPYIWGHGIKTPLNIGTYKLLTSFEDRALLGQLFMSKIAAVGPEFNSIFSTSYHGNISACQIASIMRKPFLIRLADDCAYEYRPWLMDSYAETIGPNLASNPLVFIAANLFFQPYVFELAYRHKGEISQSHKIDSSSNTVGFWGVFPSNAKVIILSTKKESLHTEKICRTLRNRGTPEERITVIDIERSIEFRKIYASELSQKKAIAITDTFSTANFVVEQITAMQKIGVVCEHHFPIFSYDFEKPTELLSCKTHPLMTFRQLHTFLYLTEKISSDRLTELQTEYKKLDRLVNAT